MHCNITYVRKKGAELVSTKSEELDVEFLAIGSDENQDVFLDDVYVISQHAEIVLHKKKLFVVAVDGESTGGVSVNNKLEQTKELKKGDILNFGDFDITVLDLDAKQSKLQLQIEKKTDGVPATRSLASRLSLRLEDTWLIKKRNWSVNIFIFIFVLFLLIPLFSYFMPSGVTEKLRSAPIIPSDNSWETGDLAHAHHIDKIGNNCNKCHQKPFVMVEDTSCANSTCHQKIQEHIDPELYSSNNLKKNRCGSCHKEHNGDDNDLIDSNDKLCFSCHHAVTEEGRYDKKREIENVVDLDTHPEFHISMHKLNRDNKKFDIERYSLENIDSLKQESNLKFPHDRHLAYKGIENKSTGEKNVKLTCETCHVPAASEAGFKPVTRKDHCQECHLLTFEPEYKDDKDRQVPHGSVADVLYYLNGYYSKRLLKGVKDEPEPAEEQETRTRRFRPGASSSTEDLSLNKQERIVSNQWVDEKVKTASKELFNATTCILCHKIVEKKGATPAWDILPVHINERWFPKARVFNHKKHASEDCLSCHNKVVSSDASVEVAKEAKEGTNTDEADEVVSKQPLSEEETKLTSAKSSDILMPKLEKCQECHTSKDEANKSQTSCVTCHGFHTNKDHLMVKVKEETE